MAIQQAEKEQKIKKKTESKNIKRKLSELIQIAI